MFLTRDEIMKHRDLPIVVVDVPEWGGTVKVKALTGRQRDAFEASIVEQRRGGKAVVQMDNIRAKFVALCVVDDNDQPLFYPSDVELLGELSAAALERVFDAGRRLSGMSQNDIEELAGN